MALGHSLSHSVHKLCAVKGGDFQWVQFPPGDETVLAGYGWTYDAAQRVKSFDSLIDGATVYDYDDLDQLTGATSDYQGSETYEYDEAGNRTGGPYVTGLLNQLEEDAAYLYRYDNEGNRTARIDKQTGKTTLYEWDYRNRLTTISSYDHDPEAFGDAVLQQTVTQTYDIWNQWIRRQVDTGSPLIAETYFIYDAGQMVMRFNALRGPNATEGRISSANRYLWGPAVDQLLAEEGVRLQGSEGTLWQLTDNLGSVRDLAEYDEASGTTSVVNHITYDSFGNVTSETAAVDHLFGYTGRAYDEETGLQNNLNRWYDAANGKWLSEDPIGFAGGDANLYRYVGNNATGATDPSGLETKREWQDIVLRKISVSRGQLGGYDRFSPANQKIMRSIYGYYSSLFANNPNFLWAGMAKMAGQTVWQGCGDIVTYRTLLGASGHAQRLSQDIERQLLQMNLEIFEDLGWMHEAYVTKGIGELEERFEAGDGEIDLPTLEAWRMIDSGMGRQGNALLLRREQEVVLNRGYKELGRLNIGKIMGTMGTSPIPGGKSFCDVVPGGDLTNFDDRWKWISVDMLPRWLSFSDKQRQRVVRIPLGNPITPDSHIDYYDIHERLKRQSLRY